MSHTPQSDDDLPQSKKTDDHGYYGRFGIILHRLEALSPLPSPWIKLGLTKLMTLVALFLGF